MTTDPTDRPPPADTTERTDTSDRVGSDGPADTTEPDEGQERAEGAGDFRRFLADPSQVDLVWRDAGGRPYGQLESARRAVEAEGRSVRLILNAGIYTPELAPAGLHVEDGVELVPLNLNEGPGNFHLLPNGVFSIADGGASVLESNAYAAAGLDPRLAVQSGPLLTIEGAIHPAFDPASSSRHVRNGVGVTTDGQVLFLQSARAVTFWELAEAFLANDAPNALYLDGTIVRMEAPTEGRRLFPNLPLAAMLVVTE